MIESSQPLHISKIISSMLGEKITTKEIFEKSREVLPNGCYCKKEKLLPKIDTIQVIVKSLQAQKEISASQICQHCSKVDCPVRKTRSP